VKTRKLHRTHESQLMPYSLARRQTQPSILMRNADVIRRRIRDSRETKMEVRARRSEGITAELPHNDQGLFGFWKDAKRKRDLRIRTLEHVLIDTAAGSDIYCGAIRNEAAL
jgi:hypothetical protein